MIGASPQTISLDGLNLAIVDNLYGLWSLLLTLTPVRQDDFFLKKNPQR